MLLKGWRDLRQHWLPFGAAWLIITMAVCLFVAFYSSFLNLRLSTELTYQRLAFLDFTLEVEGAPLAVLERIRQLPGVAVATGRQVIGGRVVVGSDAGGRLRYARARVHGLAPGSPGEVNRVHLHQGRLLRLGRGEVLLERRFAAAHQIHLGDTLRFEGDRDRASFRVVGLVSTPEYIWLAEDRQDPIPSARNLAIIFGAPGEVESLSHQAGFHQIHVRIRPGADREAVARAAESVADRYLFGPAVMREQQPSYSMLVRDQEAFAAMAVLFPSLFLTLSSLFLFVAFWQVVNQQRRQIGILMALGFSRWQCLGLYASMCASLGLLAAVVGIGAGCWLADFCTRLYTDVLGIPFVRTSLYPGWYLLAALLALGSSLVAGWLATRRVVNLPVVQALRAEFQPVRTGRAWFAGLPYLVRLPLRNLLRHPLRTLAGVLGIASGVAQIVMTLAFVDGQASTLQYYLSQVHRYDLQVNLSGIYSPADLPAISRWKGVERVEHYLRCHSRVDSDSAFVERSVWGVPEQAQLLRLLDLQGRPVSPEDQLTMGPILARQLGVRPGDRVSLRMTTPRDARRVTYSVGPVLLEPLSNPFKLALPRLQQQMARTEPMPSDGINTLLIRCQPGMARTLARRLLEHGQVAQVINLADMVGDIADLLRMLTSYEGLMFAFSGILAVALVMGTTTMNLSERTHELVTMLVLGVRYEMLARMLMVETLLLWLAGLAVGIPAGLALGAWLVNSYQSDLIQLSFALQPKTLLQVAGISLVLSLAGIVFPLRQIFRLNPAQVLGTRGD